MGAKTRLATTALLSAGAVFASRQLRERKRWSFLGRSVLITGGSRGLGLIMARQLADEGAHLTLLARSEDDLHRAAEELRSRGTRVLAIDCDVREEDQVKHAIEQAVTEYGHLDVLINNAGVIAVGPLEHLENEDFEDSLAIHFWGPLYAMKAAIPHMRGSGGRIVNVSSIGGKVAVPHLLPYSSGKFALIGLSDGMRAELNRFGIYVTTVAPGLLRTGSPPNALFKGQHEKEYSWFATFDAMPLISIDAERAASQIIEAARYGDPALTISVPAKILAALNNVTPGLIANIMAITNRLLPGPTNAEGDRLKTGWESQSAIAPSVLTTLSDQETVENNELRGRPPEAIEQEQGAA
jgi:NAD(P)-dependent dehydrogenase (short-subunit alcohol dehydrogenase family)